MVRPRVTCDLFCAVVDNLGDAGVCWRLARQLAREQAWAVRLWIDDVAALCSLSAGIDPLPDRQEAEGVEIRRWTQPFAETEPGEVVIEAFACDLPEGFVAAMARKPRPPVWLNLEYLSAEAWVAGCHGLPSPHPTLPLVKHFFFPGFAPGTGGLIREREPAEADFGPSGLGTALAVSLFCYDNPALPLLLDAWRDGGEPIACRVADGLPRRQVERWAGEPFPIRSALRRGALAILAEPFVPQRDFDRRLGTCGLNFVRGEDSFVRAQWAQRPFVWQIYPQADDAHRVKLEAFLDRYLEGLPQATRETVAAFWRAWNGLGDPAGIAQAWPAYRATLPALAAHAGPWAERIEEAGNLAENLAKFCEERL